MHRAFWTMILFSLVCLTFGLSPAVAASRPPTLPAFRLGNEVLHSRYRHLISGKRIGLITNQSGVNRSGWRTIDVLANDPGLHLAALYGPEHGIDGKAPAGAWVDSYPHPHLGIPVYSLYGATRMPTAEMLGGVDVLLYDLQDNGARTYTYISTLNYVMKAAAQHGKPVVVLDRPNPLGGETVSGPVAEDRFESFVGVDNLPMAHGMTVGELARFFNREIGCDLTVVPMEGYTRDMIWADTAMDWVQTSPNIPDIEALFGYMATGLGEGTGIHQRDQFKWIGGKGIDSVRFAALLNAAGLPGVEYIPEAAGSVGGVRLKITDYRTFNPARSGLYALAYAKQLTDFAVPQSSSSRIVMFDKVMGTDQVGRWLKEGLSPQAMEDRYADELAAFQAERERYLIYGYAGRSGEVGVIVDNIPIFFDSAPYIDAQDRTMVPLRAIGEALGAQVGWDGERRLVTLVRGEVSLRLTIDSDVAVLNGVARQMDTSAVIRNSRTMVPLRYVGEFLGAEVNWDGGSRTVTVASASL